MNSWQARFHTFSKGKRVKKGSTTTLLKWPHSSTFRATPETLAEAGFYFTPSLDTPDAVRCFTCSKELSDWEQDDDPFSEHIRRGVSCCWAIARCGLRDDMDEAGNYTFPDSTRLPSSKAMEKARLDSYGSSWPHDGVKGHSANSKKMAQAGFVFSPQGPGDDTATCFYCGTSLSGWEDGDDPLEEHHKREKKSGTPCPFFSKATSQAQRSKPAGRISSRSQSKPPSKTSTSSKKKDPEPEYDEPSSNEDTNTLAEVSRSRKNTRSKTTDVPTKTPTSRKSTRSASSTRKASMSRGAGTSETEDDLEASGSETGKRVSKNKKKGTAKTKERIAAIQEEEEENGENMIPEELPAEPLIKPKRGRPPKKKPVVAPAQSKEKPTELQAVSDVEEAPVPQKPAHSKTHSKVNIEPERDGPVASSSETKGKSSTKSTSKAVPAVKVDMPPPLLPGESSRGGSRRTQRAAESEVDEEETEPAVQAKAVTKAVTKPKAKAKPKSVVQESEDEIMANYEDEAEPHDPLPNEPSQPRQPVPSTDTGPTKSNNRKSSSTSDDAGYATAEHGMDIDINIEPVLPAPDRLPTRSFSIASSHRSNSFEVASKTTSRQGSSKPGRASSRPPSSIVRSSSRLNEVVDVSSSDEEMVPSKSSKPERVASTRRAISPPPHTGASILATAAAPNEVTIHGKSGDERQRQKSGVSQGTSRNTSKVKARHSRLVVDVVAPPHPENHGTYSKSSQDVEMDDVGTSPEDAQGNAPSRSPSDVPPVRRTTSATPPPRTPSLPPTDTEISKPGVKSSAPALPSFDEELEMDARPLTLSESDPFASFTPFLAMIPMQKLVSLTEEEYDMTLERFIRREIETQYHQLKEDAERKIALFHAKAAETRRIIESA